INGLGWEDIASVIYTAHFRPFTTGGPWWTAARAPGAPLRLVRPPRVWRRRHGDLPGQGAGHLPCRVSRPVSRCPVAVGGTVSTAAAAPPRDLAAVPRRPQIRGRVEGGRTRMIQRSGHPTVPAEHARSTALSVRGAPSVEWRMPPDRDSGA